MTDTPTTVNVPLLRKAVEWVEEQAALPEAESQWNQGTWVGATDCGTTYCVAGYIAQTLDARYQQNSVLGGVHVSDYAARALGFRGYDNDADAEELFAALNTAADVRRIAERLAGEPL